MALHYLNPEDEPRECRELTRIDRPAETIHSQHPCSCRCNGTGRLGNSDAERIEVKYLDGVGRWAWRRPGAALWKDLKAREENSAVEEARDAHQHSEED